MEQEVTTTLLRPSQPTNPHAIVLDVVARSGFMVSIGTKVVSATKQEVCLEVAKADGLLQFNGFFHGGVIASLADYAGAAATAVAGEVGVPVLTSNLNVTYLSVGDGDCLRAIGKCVKLGNRTRVAQVDVLSVKDGVSKLAAIANVLTTVNMKQ